MDKKLLFGFFIVIVFLASGCGREVEKSIGEVKPIDISKGNIITSSITELISAIEEARQGDTIILKEGSYSINSDIVVDKSGMENAPITIKGEGTVIIDGNNKAESIFFVYGSWVTIENFNLKNPIYYGVSIGNDHVSLKNLKISNTGEDGIKVHGSGTKYAVIENSDISNVADFGIDIFGSYGSIVRNNVFYGNGGGVKILNANENILVENNIFHDLIDLNEEGEGVISITESDYVKVINNILYDNEGVAIWIFGNPENTDPGYIELGFGDKDFDSEHIKIYNNIIYNQKVKYGDNAGIVLEDHPDDINIKNNIFYKIGTAVVNEGATNVVEEFNLINQDPLFIDADNGDFHLSIGSPAIDKGIDLTNDVPLDFDGNQRSNYAPWDIGVYENLE